MTIIKAVGYPRVSSDSQVDGYGLDAQERTIRGYANANGYSIAADAIFREEGVRGKTDDDHRDAFKAMLAYIDVNGVTTVIVAKLDRVARDLMVQETIIGKLRLRGVKLISVAEPDLCSDDPTRVMLRQFMGAIAQWDAAMISRRLKSGRIERAHKGERAVGARPYGYRTVKDDHNKRTTVKDDVQAETIRYIFQARKRGLSLRAIAGALNEQGVKPLRANAFAAGTIKAILDNPAYHGDLRYTVDGQTIESRNETMKIV